MLRQYHAPRGKYTDGVSGLVGPVNVGDVLRLPRELFPRGRWIVEGWLNREYSKYEYPIMRTVFIAGGHLAIVRHLGTGERRRISDWHLTHAYWSDEYE